MIPILAAVPLETQRLRQQLEAPQTARIDQLTTISGRLAEREIIIAHSGIGQVNMALAAHALLRQCQSRQVVLIGCGGSYPGSGLSNGDLVLASSECYGDLGVETDDDFLYLDKIGNKEQAITARKVHKTFEFKKDVIMTTAQTVPEAMIGPVVTVNCCSGTRSLSDKLQQRTNGICENMEGAAAAQVCQELGRNLIELRGISNPTGTRDPQQWDLHKGVERAQQALLQLLRHWPF